MMDANPDDTGCFGYGIDQSPQEMRANVLTQDVTADEREEVIRQITPKQDNGKVSQLGSRLAWQPRAFGVRH